MTVSRPVRTRLLALAVVPLLALTAACSAVSTERPETDDAAGLAGNAPESAGLQVSTSPDQDRVRTTEDPAAIDLLPEEWADKDEIVVAVSASGSAPLAFLADDDETPIGNETDIAQLVADALGKDLRLEVRAWADWPLALQSGDVDAVISNVTVTEERKETIDFSSYRIDELGWLTAADSDLVIDSREDIAGRVVGVGSGTNQEAILLEWDRLNQADGLEPIQGPEYYEGLPRRAARPPVGTRRGVRGPERLARLPGGDLPGRLQGGRHPERRLARHGPDRRRVPRRAPAPPRRSPPR